MTKTELALNVLGWADRQDNPTAIINARVLLAIATLNDEIPDSGRLAPITGAYRSEVSDSLKLLRKEAFLLRNFTLTPKGVRQIAKILNPQES